VHRDRYGVDGRTHAFKALRGIADDSIDLRQRLRMGEALLDRREPEPGSVSL